MKNSIKAGILAAGLYLSSIANTGYAQSQNPEKGICRDAVKTEKEGKIYAEENLKFRDDGPFMDLDYSTLNLSGDESLDFRKKLSSSKEIKYSVKDFKEMKSVLENLEEGCYSDNFSYSLNRDKFHHKRMVQDKKSLSALERAVKDGVISSKELGKDVKPGVYAVHMYTSNNGGIHWVEVQKAGEKSDEMEKDYTATQTQDTQETQKEVNSDPIKVEKDTKPEDKKWSTYFTVGASGNENYLEGKAGFGWGPFEIVANHGGAKNETVKDFISPFPNGTHAQGKVENENINLVGAALEIHPLRESFLSPFVGGGMNHWRYNTKVDEKILSQDGDILSQNGNTLMGSENSWKVYGGLNVGKDWKFGLSGGYDSRIKGFAGVRISKKLNGKK